MTRDNHVILEGDTLDWFLWVEKHVKFDSWMPLKSELNERFTAYNKKAQSVPTDKSSKG